MKNGRCRLHGGKSTGVPGNKNALRTGAYVDVLSEEDQEIFWALHDELGKLDKEISLLRFRLREILKQKRKWEEAHPDGEGLEAVEAVHHSPEGLLEGMELERFHDTDAGKFPGRTVTLKKPDWDGLILRFEGSISRSEERRAKLLEQGELREMVQQLAEEIKQQKGKAKDGEEEGSSEAAGN